jgi:hypothetical protein
MKVTAYAALDGSLHKSKAEAAAASILYLGRTQNNDFRGQLIGPAEVAFIITNHKKITAILNEIDQPDVEPNCGSDSKSN